MINAMCELRLKAYYFSDLVVEVRNRLTFTRLIVNQYETPENESVRVALSHNGRMLSRIGFLHRTVFPSSGVKDIPMTMVPSRLPEIPFPHSDGNIYKWPAFRDRFLVILDGRAQLPNIDKIYNQLGCFKGNALEVASEIPVSAYTYKFMWSTLESRYNKPPMDVSSLVAKLLSAPMLSQESLVSLNKFMSIFDD